MSVDMLVRGRHVITDPAAGAPGVLDESGRSTRSAR
jgi:hypothetical protein